MTRPAPSPSSADGSTQQWLLEVEADPSLPTLVLFPHAGAGAAAYWRLALSLRDIVRPLVIRLPGRESRTGEPMYTDHRPLLRSLAPVLRPHLGREFVLYGHSMGALLAFETARLFSLAYDLYPSDLIVSGMEAPQDTPTGHARHTLTDQQLWDVMADMGGVPPEIIADHSMRQMLLPVLRADFELTDTYAFRAMPRLSCPVTAFAGQGDPELAPEAMAGWQANSTGPFAHLVLPGDHFFNLDPGSGFTDEFRKQLLSHSGR